MNQATAPQSFVDKVIMLDGVFVDERELLLAAWADGHDEATCRAIVAREMASVEEEMYAQCKAEMAAEDALIFQIENAGWEETLREEAMYR